MARWRTLIGAAAMLVVSAGPARAQHSVPPAPGMWQSLDPQYRLGAEAHQRLLASLKRITGFTRVGFAPDGRLEVGEIAPGRGSAVARRILLEAMASRDLFVIESHADSPAVNFGQIEGMDYINDSTDRHDRVWWIRLDGSDFGRIDAPPRVRSAFDEGFTLLHELLHAGGCRDTSTPGDLGECETILNQARAELGLPRRAEYLATSIRRPVYGLAAVRLRFIDPQSARPNQIEDLFVALSMAAPATSTALVGRRIE
jgi:hypothetical protein